MFLHASWRIAASIGFLSLAVLFVVAAKNTLRRSSIGPSPSNEETLESDVDQLVELLEQSRRIDDLQTLVDEELAARKRADHEDKDSSGSVH